MGESGTGRYRERESKKQREGSRQIKEEETEEGSNK